MSTIFNQVGLHISEEKIQLVEICNKENYIYLENVDEEFFDESLAYDTKESKFIHILQNAFNEIILRKSLISSRISISLPLSFFKIFEIPIDKNLTQNDIRDYIDWELSKLFPDLEKNSFSYQNTELNSFGYKSYKKYLVYLISVDILKRINKFCLRNNLQLKAIDNSHTAATSIMFNQNLDNVKLSLFVENGKFSLLLFSNKNLVFEKSKEFANISEIPTIVKNIINEIHSSEFEIQNLNKLFISGNSVSTELINNIQSATNLSPEIFLPFNKLKINPSLEGNKFVNDNSQKFTSATGMAFRLVS